MYKQPNDYLLEPLWSLKKAVARLWSPEPRLANLNSTAAANLCPGSAPPTLRTPSSANPAAHRVTISYGQVEHYTKETGNCSQSGPRSP